MTKIKTIIRWILLIFVTVAFLGVGTMKLLGTDIERALFAGWHYPLWFMYFTGACEVIGAIGLHVKKVSRWATYGLICVTIGAIFTHVYNNEPWTHPIAATLLMLSLFGILYLSKTKSLPEETGA